MTESKEAGIEDEFRPVQERVTQSLSDILPRGVLSIVVAFCSAPPRVLLFYESGTVPCQEFDAVRTALLALPSASASRSF